MTFAKAFSTDAIRPMRFCSGWVNLFSGCLLAAGGRCGGWWEQQIPCGNDNKKGKGNSKGKGRSRSRFPAGMTTRRAKATARARATTRRARATTRSGARAKADSLRLQPNPSRRRKRHPRRVARKARVCCMQCPAGNHHRRLCVILSSPPCPIIR